MKNLNQYIQERLIINKNFNKKKQINITVTPKDHYELKDVIEDRYKKLGPGTEQKPIDFNDIDTSKITSFDKLFSGMYFKYIDVSLWNTSRVDSVYNMFYDCDELVSTGDIGEWDVSNVTVFDDMFANCTCIKNIGDLSDWDVSNAETFAGMFFNCMRLESIGDLSYWEVTDKLTNTFAMFGMCYKLKNIGDIGKWKMKNVTNMTAMFSGCRELEYIGDITSWDLSNVTAMTSIFRTCNKLTYIGDLSKWAKPKNLTKKQYANAFFDSSIKKRHMPKWKF